MSPPRSNQPPNSAAACGAAVGAAAVVVAACGAACGAAAVLGAGLLVRKWRQIKCGPAPAGTAERVTTARPVVVAGQAATTADTPATEVAWQETTAAAKWGTLTLEQIRRTQAGFAVEREWTQFHKPRNLCTALVAEVGELAEALGLWREVGYGGSGLTEAQKVHVGEELTDCLVYLVRLGDVLDLDVPRAVLTKMEKNAAKYPADMVRGSSKKYTEYKEAARANRKPA